MDGYQRVLQLSKERLQPESFPSLRQMGNLSLREMVHYSGFLNNKINIRNYREMSPDDIRRSNLRTLKRQGIYLAKKACVVFGQMNDNDEQLALPMVATSTSPMTMWHSDIVDDYQSWLGRVGNHKFTTPSYPELFTGEVFRMKHHEKPVFSMHAWCSGESIQSRTGLLERLSSDFPDSQIVVSESCEKFYIFDDGNTKEMKITC